MELADRFKVPLVTLVDTAGAYPGIGAEERGQAEAIARSTDGLPVAEASRPSSVIIGEGGSGGAIAIATANRVYMLEHAIYSVISPEGAASILWHDSTRAQDAATSMKITAQDLLDLKIVDGIIRRTAGRRPPRARCRDRLDRRPDRPHARRFRRPEHGFSRAAPRKVPGHRPLALTRRAPRQPASAAKMRCRHKIAAPFGMTGAGNVSVGRGACGNRFSRLTGLACRRINRFGAGRPTKRRLKNMLANIFRAGVLTAAVLTVGLHRRSTLSDLSVKAEKPLPQKRAGQDEGQGHDPDLADHGPHLQGRRQARGLEAADATGRYEL